jgi:hypothetical protein
MKESGKQDKLTIFPILVLFVAGGEQPPPLVE